MNAFQQLVYNQSFQLIYLWHDHQYHIVRRNLFYHLYKERIYQSMNNQQGEILFIHYSQR